MNFAVEIVIEALFPNLDIQREQNTSEEQHL